MLFLLHIKNGGKKKMNKKTVLRLLNGFVITMFLVSCANTGSNKSEPSASGGGCCQVSDAQCQDVTRASQCRGLGGPGGGDYHEGLSCNEKTHKCE